MRAILGLCDLHQLQKTVLWVPRETNQFADYLSICPHILIGLPCTGGSEELRRIEIRLAAKSNNKQIINMNRQYLSAILSLGKLATLKVCCFMSVLTPLVD